MKTIQLRCVIVVMFIVIGSTIAKAQDQRTCTVIDVNGGIYFDRTWLFTVQGTTQAFDNGWDSYKFLTTGSAMPQIYVLGIDGNFQVGTVGSANNTIIGFIPGEATQYTFKFTHTDLAYSYQELYLYDKVADKIVDIYAQGITYTFTASTSDIKERFIILTSIATDSDNGESPDNTDVITDNGSDTGSDTQVDHNNKKKNKNRKDKKNCKENNAEEVKAYCYGKKIVINNPNKQKVHIKVVNSKNAKVVKEINVPAETITSVDANSGIYVIITTVEADINSKNVIVY